MKIVTYSVADLLGDSYSRFDGCKVTLDGDIITFQVCIYAENGEEERLVERRMDYSFDLNEVLKLSEDHGYILVSAPEAVEPRFTAEQVIHSTFFSKKFPTHVKPECIRLFWLLTPYKGCTLNEATLLLYDDGKLNLSELSIDLQVEERYLAYQQIAIDGPTAVAAGGTISLDILQAIPGTTIYLETTSGLLNRARLTNSNTVQFIAQGLEPGETVKIKAGYKYWSGDAEHFITIT